MDPLPNQAELRVRLQHDSFDGNAALELMHEIRELGESAAPLMPLLVSRLKKGTLMCDSASAVHVYLSTGSAELLAFIRSPDFWRHVGTYERSQLFFPGGVADLEEELLTFLWQNFAKPGEPMRRYVVESLGEAGTGAALETLKLVDSRLSGEIPERAMSTPSQEEEPSIAGHLSRIELAAQQEFLQLVRETIKEIESRNG